MPNFTLLQYFAAPEGVGSPGRRGVADLVDARAQESDFASDFPPAGLTAAILFGTVLVLALISVTLHGLQYYEGAHRYARLVRLFNLSGEGNIPAWFSSMLLFSCAILLGSIAANKARRAQPFVRHWTFLAVTFVYLSMDEAAEIHEMANHPLRSLVHAHGLLYQAWVVPAIAFLGLFLVAYAPFLKLLPRATRLLFIGSGAAYIAGALGVEMISSYVEDYHTDSLVIRGGLATLEDFLEMSGLVLFIYTLLRFRTEAARS